VDLKLPERAGLAVQTDTTEASSLPSSQMQYGTHYQASFMNQPTSKPERKLSRSSDNGNGVAGSHDASNIGPNNTGPNNMGAHNRGDEYSGRSQKRPSDHPQSFDPHAIWQQLQSELALEQGGSLDRWVHDTWVIAYEDGEFIIGLPDAFRYDWVVTRLRSQIKRKLAVIVGRSSIDVKFRVQPRSVAEAPDLPPTPLYAQHAELSPGDETALTSASSANTLSMGAAAMPRAERSLLTAQVNPRHTFANFVVGSHNKLAHAVAQAVAERPGSLYNPLFVYGGVGLGKTHLLHAVAIELAQHGREVLYCTSEEFTNELISSIRHTTTDQFRAKYRQVDVLLIDDIQFISGKESTQEEFFHTFNHLHAAGKQIVISSDRPPKALATLEERLRSRFEGGIQTDIQTPDFETRVAILQSKAQRVNLRVTYDVLMLLAERVDSNVRELEGALNNLCMQAQMLDMPLTVSLAGTILNNLAPRRTPCSPPRVIHLVAQHYGLTVADLTGRSRTAPIAHARQVTMYLLREESALSLPAIGDHLGGRDHTTVRHGVEKIHTDLERDELLRKEVTLLREKMYQPVAG
jgi:chromosomal replication initiator protein